MRTFSTAIDIATPVDRVWEVMIDTERWHEWTASIRSVKRLDVGPFAVGSRAFIRQPKLPPARWTVTALEPGRGFTWVSTAPGVRVVAHHQVAAAAGGSRAALSIDTQGPLGGLLGWLTGGITERYLALEASGLKARSEQPDFRLTRRP